MSMIPWKDWRTALYNWAVTSSGGRAVIWARQEKNVGSPKRPYVVLDVMGVRKVGEDGQHLDYDASQPDGQQQVTTQYGTRRLRLSVQVFANATGYLEDSAVSIAQDLSDSLDNPAAQQGLVEAGLGVSEVGEVQNLAEIEQSQFAGRASLDVTLEGAAVQPGAAKGQYVGRVIGTGDVEGNSAPEVTFDVTG